MASARGMIRSASVVSAGTLLGQLIAFVGSLVLVRIYSPEQMGLFTTVVAISSFLSPLASGRLSNAVPLPQSHRSSIVLVKLAIFGTLIIGSIVAIVLMMRNVLAEGENIAGDVWWWGVPALLVSFTVYTSANQLAVRFQRYFGLAVRGVLYPLVMTGAQIVLGFLFFGAGGLILGMILGHVVTALTLWGPIRHALKDAPPSPGDRWQDLLRSYKKFPLVLGPSGAINAFAMQLPQIGVTFIFGLAVGGQFGMMMKILAVPITLIGQSIGFVYAGQIARVRREGEANVQRLFDRLSLILGLVAIVFAFGTVLLAEPVFTFLLGETWRVSGQLAALYVFATATQLIASPLSQTLLVSERTAQQLAIDVIRALMVLIVFGFVYFMGLSINISVVLVGVVSAVGYFLLWAINRKAAADIRPN